MYSEINPRDMDNKKTDDFLEIPKSMKIKYQLGFTFIGLVNNLIYVLILSSAQDVAAHFHQESFMGLLSFALILPSAGIIILNSIYLLKISHKIRILITCLVNMIGCAIFAIFSNFNPSKTYAFYICVSAALVSGATQAIGEGVMIAFIKKFPSDCISGWSSGTGFAGLFGAGLYLFLKSFNVQSYIVFSSVIPFIVLYAVVFMWLNKNQPKLQLINKPQSVIQQYDPSQQRLSQKEDNTPLNWSNVIPISKKILFACINIALVYYFQYTVITCFSAVLNKKSKLPIKPSFLEVHAYQILSFMYQLGVCISRSSLYIFNIKRWGVLTILQLINFVGWFIFSFFTLSVWIQFLWMLFVGLIGGSSYVNIYYDILDNKDKVIQQQQKQVSINIILVWCSVGITFATLSTLLLSNTAFK